jgi:hypothetical protein
MSTLENKRSIKLKQAKEILATLGLLNTDYIIHFNLAVYGNKIKENHHD